MRTTATRADLRARVSTLVQVTGMVIRTNDPALRRVKGTVRAEASRLLEFVRQKAEKARTSQRVRLGQAATWRDGDEQSHREAHKLAERMGGRKITYQDAASRERLAQIDERIAVKDGEEAATYEALAALLDEGPDPETIATALSERRWPQPCPDCRLSWDASVTTDCPLCQAQAAMLAIANAPRLTDPETITRLQQLAEEMREVATYCERHTDGDVSSIALRGFSKRLSDLLTGLAASQENGK
jgi:hypothetical protein